MAANNLGASSTPPSCRPVLLPRASSSDGASADRRDAERKGRLEFGTVAIVFSNTQGNFSKFI